MGRGVVNRVAAESSTAAATGAVRCIMVGRI